MPSPLISRIVAIALLAISAQPIFSNAARAHAAIIESAPAVDSVVTAGDIDVTLRFNSRIDHQRSRLTLTSADGAVRAIPIVTDSAADIVSAKMPGLGAGQYRLRWQVLAIDGHLTRGDIPFSVKAP